MGLLAKLTGKTAARKGSTDDMKTTAVYRGVQIVGSTDGCCQAAADIAGQRYLADQVPRLPLDGCDAANCGCTFELFDDRRSDSRRASDVSYNIASELRAGENKRGESRGRRNDDC